MAFRYFVAILAIGAVCCDAMPTLGHENLGVNANISGIVSPCVEPCGVTNTTDAVHEDKMVVVEGDNITSNVTSQETEIEGNVIVGNGHEDKKVVVKGDNITSPATEIEGNVIVGNGHDGEQQDQLTLNIDISNGTPQATHPENFTDAVHEDKKVVVKGDNITSQATKIPDNVIVGNGHHGEQQDQLTLNIDISNGTPQATHPENFTDAVHEDKKVVVKGDNITSQATKIPDNVIVGNGHHGEQQDQRTLNIDTSNGTSQATHPENSTDAVHEDKKVVVKGDNITSPATEIEGNVIVGNGHDGEQQDQLTLNIDISNGTPQATHPENFTDAVHEDKKVVVKGDNITSQATKIHDNVIVGNGHHGEQQDQRTVNIDTSSDTPHRRHRRDNVLTGNGKVQHNSSFKVRFGRNKNVA